MSDETRDQLWTLARERIEELQREIGFPQMRSTGYVSMDGASVLVYAEARDRNGLQWDLRVEARESSLTVDKQPRTIEPFWDNVAAEPDTSRVVVDGHCYTITPDSARPGWGDGFSGREFRIRFHDGRMVVSRNLWARGQVPPQYRDRLPDNAVFEPAARIPGGAS